LQDNLYHDDSVLIAVAIVHQGPALAFMSKTLYGALIGKAMADIADVVDRDVKEQIDKVSFKINSIIFYPYYNCTAF